MDPVTPNGGPGCDALGCRLTPELSSRSDPCVVAEKAWRCLNILFPFLCEFTSMPGVASLCPQNCPNLNRREDKSGFPFGLRAFKSCLGAKHLPGQSVLSLACREERAVWHRGRDASPRVGVSSLCLVLETGWELAEVCALASHVQVPECIAARSVQPFLRKAPGSGEDLGFSTFPCEFGDEVSLFLGELLCS